MKLNRLALIFFSLKNSAVSSASNESFLEKKIGIETTKTNGESFRHNVSSRNLVMEGEFEQIGDSINGVDPYDWFGYRVRLSSDGMTVAVAATKADGSNKPNIGKVSVYTYSFTSDTWNQIGQDIDGSGKHNWAGKGLMLSPDGRTVIVGAPYFKNNGFAQAGQVRVFSYQPFANTWTQIGQVLTGGNNKSEEYGYAVDLSTDGQVIAIGAPGYDDSVPDEHAGKVEVYEWSVDSWTKRATLETDDLEDQFGHAVSLSDDGSILAVGSKYGMIDTVYYGGDAHVYEWDPSLEEYEQIGGTIIADANCDQFGYRLSLSRDGKYLAIGGYQNDENGDDSGHVKVYKYQNSDWKQLGNDIYGQSEDSEFGHGVDISADGQTVVVGATNHDNATGYASVFSWDKMANDWVQVGKKLYGEAEEDYFGWDVSMSSNGEIVAIGGPDNKGGNDPGSETGHVRIFKYMKRDPEPSYGEFEAGTKQIKLDHGNGSKCLQITKKKVVVFKSCKSSNSFQKWNQHTLGLIRSNKYQDFCLTADKSKVKMVKCNGGDPSTWVFNVDGSATSGPSNLKYLNGASVNGKWKIMMKDAPVNKHVWTIN